MGPAVCAAELDGNLDYIKVAQDEGAELCWGGERLGEGDLEHGHFMSPAVIANVKNDMRIAQEEVFGPVIGVVKSGGFEEAISLANDIEYGLSASIITRDINKAMRYTDQIEAGVVKINQISTGLALQVPFGSEKFQHKQLQGAGPVGDRLLHAGEIGLSGLLGGLTNGARREVDGK